MIHSNALTQKVAEFVRNNPGATRPNVLKVLPEGTKPHTVSGILGHLAKGGVIENRGRSGRAASWFPIDISVKAFYLKIASMLLSELKGVHHSQREVYLAKRLEEIFGAKNN
jgi:hypothetical protein